MTFRHQVKGYHSDEIIIINYNKNTDNSKRALIINMCEVLTSSIWHSKYNGTYHVLFVFKGVMF